MPFSHNKLSNSDPHVIERSLLSADKFTVSDVCELAELRHAELFLALFAMLTMKKETLEFHNYYAGFSSVSPISIGMGLLV